MRVRSAGVNGAGRFDWSGYGRPRVHPAVEQSAAGGRGGSFSQVEGGRGGGRNETPRVKLEPGVAVEDRRVSSATVKKEDGEMDVEKTFAPNKV